MLLLTAYTGGGGGQIFDLFERTYFMDDPLLKQQYCLRSLPLGLPRVSLTKNDL